MNSFKIKHFCLDIIVVLIMCVLFFLAVFTLRLLQPQQDIFTQLNLVFFFLLILVFLKYILFERNIDKIHWNISIYLLLFALLLSHNLASTALLNIDRSRSFYILAWVDKYPITINNIERDVQLYVESSEKLNANAIKLRVKEQIDRGIFSVESNRLYLTFKGKIILSGSNVLGSLFRLDNWTINSK